MEARTDQRTARRIDSLYRNIKSFQLLMILSVFVPLLLLFVAPLSLAYLYLRRKLLLDVSAGRILIPERSVELAACPGGISTTEKVDFISKHDTRLWIPVFVIVAAVALIGTLVATS